MEGLPGEFYSNLVSPRSKNADARGREFILNVFLIGALFLSTLALAINQYNIIQEGSKYDGVPSYLIPLFFLLFVSLLLLSRVGLYQSSSYFLVSLYFISATYTLYSWGVDVPIALLVYALAIVMSGVLINARSALVVALLASALLVAIQYFQDSGRMIPETYWKFSPSTMTDTLLVVSVLGIIVIVSWLSNREIEKSLRRARSSEKALKEERDHLEGKVEERTRELKKVQLEKLTNMYRLAEFGRMASGLFHDFINPLSVVHLNLEELRRRGKYSDLSELPKVDKLVERAMDGTRRMERCVQAARRQVQRQETSVKFLVTEEIKQVIQMLEYRAREMKVKICLDDKHKIELHGDPVKFNQFVTNLVTNAVDAYKEPGEEKRQEGNRKVAISVRKLAGSAVIAVQDWGRGISGEDMKRIYEPFFTTKDVSKGTGIGLSICKKIVEKSFAGSIAVDSKKGEGSIFTVTIPLDQS